MPPRILVVDDEEVVCRAVARILGGAGYEIETVQDGREGLRRAEAGAYDLIILDPPAFAKHKDVLRNALQGYQKLNAKAFRKIKPGGILFTFSCSQVVSKDNFRLAVFSAAAQSGRKVRILHQFCRLAHTLCNFFTEQSNTLSAQLRCFFFGLSRNFNCITLSLSCFCFSDQ